MCRTGPCAVTACCYEFRSSGSEATEQRTGLGRHAGGLRNGLAAGWRAAARTASPKASTGPKNSGTAVLRQSASVGKVSMSTSPMAAASSSTSIQAKCTPGCSAAARSKAARHSRHTPHHSAHRQITQASRMAGSSAVFHRNQCSKPLMRAAPSRAGDGRFRCRSPTARDSGPPDAGWRCSNQHVALGRECELGDRSVADPHIQLDRCFRRGAQHLSDGGGNRVRRC